MADEKKAPWFKFWMRNKNNFDAMTDEQAGKTLKALLNYYDSGEEPQNLGPWEKATFNNMRQELDECTKSYQTRVEKNRANGEKGGRPPKEKPTGYLENPAGYSHKPNGFSKGSIDAGTEILKQDFRSKAHFSVKSL